MSKFYYKYTPIRSGLSGIEFIESFLSEHFNGVTYDAIVSKDMTHYGILNGTGDEFSLAMRAIEGRYSAQRLNLDAFVGECYMIYREIPDSIEGMPVKPEFREYMNRYDTFFTDLVTDLEVVMLPYVKRAKEDLFKELTKRKFYDYNDLCADITKTMTVLSIYYPELTPTEKATVDYLITVIKAGYSKSTAIGGMTALVSKMSDIMINYYASKTALANAATIDDAIAVVYE